jgi:3-hydroxyacyl-CoA dehydrogenase
MVEPRQPTTVESIAVAGSGAIACGIAVVAASRLGASLLVARSEESADRARAVTGAALEKLKCGADVPDLVRRMADDGRVRRKAGAGFFEYTPARA